MSEMYKDNKKTNNVSDRWCSHAATSHKNQHCKKNKNIYRSVTKVFGKNR